MTCIVGVSQDGSVWLGGDSLAIRDGIKVTIAGSKVTKRGEFLIGTCGSHRLLNLACHVFDPPPLVADADLDAYMANEFSSAWRACLKDNGALTTEDGVESQDGQLLVGVRGALYEMDAQFGVIRSRDNCSAIGSGDNIALGALYGASEVPPRKRVHCALLAAEKWNDGVRGPFTILPPESKADRAMLKAWEAMHRGKRTVKDPAPGLKTRIPRERIREAVKSQKQGR